MTKPRIRIEFAGGDHPANTKVFNEDGSELLCVERIVLDLDVHKSEPEAIIGATVYAVDVRGTQHVQVEDLKVKVLPPPPAKTTYRLTIGEPQKNALGEDVGCRYTLIRSTPLPTYGSVDEEIASGGMPVIGPLELVFEEAT